MAAMTSSVGTKHSEERASIHSFLSMGENHAPARDASRARLASELVHGTFALPAHPITSVHRRREIPEGSSFHGSSVRDQQDGVPRALGFCTLTSLAPVVTIASLSRASGAWNGLAREVPHAGEAYVDVTAAESFSRFSRSPHTPVETGSASHACSQGAIRLPDSLRCRRLCDSSA
jgi:hypothetical protein